MKVAVTVKHWRDAFPSGLLLFAVPLPSNNTFSTLTVKVCCRPKGRGAPWAMQEAARSPKASWKEDAPAFKPCVPTAGWGQDRGSTRVLFPLQCP